MHTQVAELLQKTSNLIVEFVVKYSFQVLGGIVILLVGFKLASWLSRLFVRLCERKHVDVTLAKPFVVGDTITVVGVTGVVETVVGVSYEDNPEKAIRVIRQALQGFPQIAQLPAAQVGIREFGDSSVNIGLRCWVPTKQFFQTLYEVNLAVYKALKATGITIPFPQRDVHLVSK